jgi:hypothetical protein
MISLKKTYSVGVILCIITAFIYLTGCSKDKPNEPTDGNDGLFFVGFESGLSGWTCETDLDGSYEITTNEAYSGNHSLYIWFSDPILYGGWVEISFIIPVDGRLKFQTKYIAEGPIESFVLYVKSLDEYGHFDDYLWMVDAGTYTTEWIEIDAGSVDKNHKIVFEATQRLWGDAVVEWYIDDVKITAE